MRWINVLIILVLCNLVFLPSSVIAAGNKPKLFEDEKVLLDYVQRGNILLKNENLKEDLTKKEFFNWLQFLSYDTNNNLISVAQSDSKKIKTILAKLNILSVYEKWEQSGSLNKQLNISEMYSILYQLIGYQNLSEVQINQLNEIAKITSKEEKDYLTKNKRLDKKTAAIIYSRFLKRFQTISEITPSQLITSDKPLFIKEGPSSKFQHVIDIPKSKPFYIIAKFGNVHFVKYNGKIGYLSSNISYQVSQSEKNNYIVTSNQVNVRLGPSTKFPVIRTVNKNEKLVGFQYNADWIQINDKNNKAFISSKYSKKLSTVENDENTENLVKKVYVVADKLNVRELQSTSSRIIGTVFKGEGLEVSEKFSKWTKIKYKNTIGFVSNDYITEKEPIVKQQDIVIAIDAGHGGKDPGTHFGQLYEKDITLDTAIKVKSTFNQSNVKVVLTRETDGFLGLSERVNIAKNNKAILFVSIHVNSGSGENGGGAETYYYGENGKNPYISQSQQLASAIQTEMLSAWHLSDRGVHHGNFQVIRDNNMPAVLTELGFIDSKKDQSFLSSSQQRQIIAGAIHDGISHYLISKGVQVK